MTDKRWVLYADDDVDDREIFSDSFQEVSGYDLVTFTSGTELLTFLTGEAQRNGVCLVVLDINMPGLTGVQTLEALKGDERFRHIPTVLFSTSGSPGDRKRAAELDTPVILKPSNYGDITHTIKSLLRHGETVNKAA